MNLGFLSRRYGWKGRRARLPCKRKPKDNPGKRAHGPESDDEPYGEDR